MDIALYDIPYIVRAVLAATVQLWLPLVAADNAGGIARILHLPLWNVRTSSRWFGNNKTVAPFYLGPLLAYGVTRVEFWVVGYDVSEFWCAVVGVLAGVGAVLGDHVKSFVKRRLAMADGAPWYPWDQIDYAVGGCAGYIAWWVIMPWTPFALSLFIYGVIVLLALLTKPTGNLVLYKLGLRNTPH